MTEEVLLICDYDRCRKPILDRTVGYLPSRSKIYHEGDCFDEGRRREVASISDVINARPKIISRNDAEELRAQGLLAQFRGSLDD